MKLTTIVKGYPTTKTDFLFERRLSDHLPGVIAEHSKGKPTLVFCRQAPCRLLDCICMHNQKFSPAKCTRELAGAMLGVSLASQKGWRLRACVSHPGT